MKSGEDIAGSKTHSIKVALRLPAWLARPFTPSFSLSIALPAWLSRALTPGLSVTLGELGIEGALVEVTSFDGSGGLEEGVGRALGLPTRLSWAFAPAFIFSNSLGVGVSGALPAWLAGTLAPWGGEGIALDGGIGVAGEMGFEVEVVVEGFGGLLGKGDNVGEVVDDALGLEGGTAREMGEFGLR